MRRIVLLAVLVFLLNSGYRAVSAQNTSAGLKTGTIEGLVTRTTGEPIAEAQVTVTPVANGPAHTAMTTADGRYSVADLPAGQYTLRVTRTLFARARRDSTRTVELTAGEHLTAVNIQLAPTGVIAGRIFDEERQPLRSVRVEALRYQYRDGTRVLSVEGQTQSDDRGEYRIFNLKPDLYFIRATTPGNAAQPPIYYPDVPDSLDAAPINVGSGGEIAAIDVSIAPRTTFSARLKIVSALPLSALPTATISVLFHHRGITETVNVQTAAPGNGVYALSGLVPGSYDVFAQVRSSSGGQTVTQTGRLSLEVNNADLDAGTLALQPSETMAGRFLYSEAPPGSVRYANVSVALRPINGLPSNLGTNSRSAGATMADDGSFTIPNVAAGQFRVFVTGLPASASILVVRYKGRDISDSGLVVDGSALGALEVVLGGPGSVGTVEGVARDANDKPVSEALVALIPEANRRGNPSAFKATNTDRLGAFSITGVPPGTYTLLAWDDIEAGAYQNSDFLKDYENRGTKLTVERGARNVLNTVRVITTP
jgi:hypothetical protein